uniref:Ferritin n=1 Tax=Helicotheca tamesis TaxID=374047 RepID=A0A7S2HAW9_9STRA|mmetsp:Transcript_16699/g.22874  ORF Transcript_16699/g.22874 Transcript_16699/m.22874 type:complete len:209 (+) Transcript_16699:129-755(+)|eukprot:CAMPEP_0185726094 /NCGR_PEP_ID=MMETSP1171-20130828/2173_1 /TAXON_ID=374046 /ORGANISM="Helicotheca tamensis, Strain CCMP826" /LENGTH=208 /DNA_ID=CAMNT_0028394375 /DNA_START=104 /DNA_END=730 /DNA_ORIENTATION=-
MKTLISTSMTAVLAGQTVLGFAPTGTRLSKRAAFSRLYSSMEEKLEKKKELERLFSLQVTNEMAASQVYLSASIWCDQNDLVGMASFMLSESSEERDHALAFVDFAMKRDIPVRLESVPAPPADWDTPEELWSDLMKVEKQNTAALMHLASVSQDVGDFAISTFLMPYHMEQVDSEDKLGTILAKVRDENQTPGLLRQLDTELGHESK